MGHLLIIAPHDGMQKSLRFALEAAGHAVTAYRSIKEVKDPPGAFDCVILDHHGATGKAEDIEAFFAAWGPVVLLANEADHPLSSRSFRTILKPLLGPLSSAVTDAISTRLGVADGPH